MARTGLRNIEARYSYVSAVLALKKGWSTTGMTAERRAAAMVKAANAALAMYGVPAIGHCFAGQSSPFGALFGHQAWKVELDKRAFAATKAPSDADVAELVDSVYHESRHAEQWFLSARYLLGQGSKPDELAAFGLRHEVVLEAKRHPLTKGSPEEGLAKRLADCLFSKEGLRRIIETQDDLDSLSEGSTVSPKEKKLAQVRLALTDFKKDVTDPKVLQQRAHRAYQNQFPEVDAWDTGRLAAELYKHQAWMTLPKVPVHVG